MSDESGGGDNRPVSLYVDTTTDPVYPRVVPDFSQILGNVSSELNTKRISLQRFSYAINGLTVVCLLKHKTTLTKFIPQ